MAAAFHLYFEQHAILLCDEVIASVLPLLAYVLNGVAAIREVSRGSGQMGECDEQEDRTRDSSECFVTNGVRSSIDRWDSNYRSISK